MRRRRSIHGVEGGNMKSMHDISQFSAKLSRRKAIRARCIDCSGFIKSEVRNYNHADCVLHPFRAGRGKQNPIERDRAIRKYCLWCTCDQRKEILLWPSTDCPLYPYRLAQKTLKKRKNEHIEGNIRGEKLPAIPLPHNMQKIADNALGGI